MAYALPYSEAPPAPDRMPLYRLYEAANVLKSCGIGCSMWCEDLLWHLGAHTVAFEHFLIVADPEATACVLEEKGFRRAGPNERYRFLTELLKNSVRLLHPSDIRAQEVNGDTKERPAAVLLSASTWHFPPAQLDAMTDIMPPIALVAASFIDTYLDAESIDFSLRMASNLTNLAAHIKRIKLDDVIGQLKHDYQRQMWRSLFDGTFYGARKPEWLEQRQAALKLENLNEKRSEITKET